MVVLVAVLAFAIGYVVAQRTVVKPDVITAVGHIDAHFSPRGDCTSAAIAEIDSARQTLHVQAYSFTSEPIATAIASAESRGVRVTVVLDKSVYKERSAVDTLTRANVPVFVDERHAIAHNKVMIIDGKDLITGSFNYTYAAEHSNAENMLVIHDAPNLVSQYEAAFAEHQGHSAAFESSRVSVRDTRGARED